MTMQIQQAEQVVVTMSPTIGAIAAALAKAQLAMRPAVKDAANPHFNSRFASLASCVEALKPLHENGIAVVQPTIPHGAEGVCVITLLLHASGEWIRGELYMPAAKRDPQGFGSALSYARRYCLAATTGLATDDDDDAETASRSAKQSQSQSRKPIASTAAPDGIVGKALTDRLNDGKNAEALAQVVSDVQKAAKAKQITPQEFAELKALHAKRLAAITPKPDPAALLNHFESRLKAAKSMAELKGIGAEIARSGLDIEPREYLDGVYMAAAEQVEAA